ncbi:MAG: DUF4115 domain-containing protein [Elusimicrobia bacterium]|nr:DUF4115 domain-containing protein [Elusimicrobiota bacterium]
MNGPGAILQHERLAKKLTIDRVHRETKIKSEYIEAIEHDDVDAFPAEVYYKNFLKTYAKYLYLDAAEMISIYEQVKIEKYQEYLRLNKKDTLGERLNKIYNKYKKVIVISLISLAALLFILLVVKIVYNINSALPEDEIMFDKYEQKAADTLQNADIEIAEQENGQEEKTERSETQAVVKEQPKQELNKIDEITLQINAKQNTWIKLYSDTRVSFEGILQKSHHYTSKAKNRFLLKVGNTDGVEVLFNNEVVDVSKGTRQNKVNTLEFKRD